MSAFIFPTHLPRHAFTPREVARASDLWRVCQDVAVEGSSRAGWTPLRYLAAGSGYVVRRMTVVHHREIAPVARTLWAKTWVSENRRGLVSVRQIRLYADQALSDCVTSATQEWAHIDRKTGLKKAPPELVEAFTLLMLDADAELPPCTDTPGSESLFACRMWHLWRDALGHLNHPSYLDLVDESVYARAFAHGLDTALISAHAETIRYRDSINAGDQVQVHTRLAGRVDAERCMFHHRMMVGERLCAESRSVRGYPGAGVLATAFA